MSATRVLLLCGAAGVGLTFGSASLHASQQDIATINSAPCELLGNSFDEGGGRREPVHGILRILDKLLIMKSEFGTPEEKALMSRLQNCYTVARSTSPTATSEMPLKFNTIIQLLGTIYSHADNDASVYSPRAVGIFIKEVDQNRANAERQQADAERQQKARAAQEATEKQAREQAAAEAEVILGKIHQLSVSDDLVATYNEIATLSDRIKQLPPDIKSDLLDALQIAAIPIDKRRNAILSDSQGSLLEIQKLPDDEEKLRRLGELAKSIQAVPGSEAATLAGAVETMRDATRVKMSESANNDLDAATIAERDQAKAVTEEERARQRAAEEAAAAVRAQRDKLQASTDEATQRVAVMIGIFSVAKVCAENHIIYDESKVDTIKERVSKYIDANKIPREQVNRIWTVVQGQLATMPIKESDCAALGSNISSAFGDNVFEGTVVKNPF